MCSCGGLPMVVCNMLLGALTSALASQLRHIRSQRGSNPDDIR